MIKGFKGFDKDLKCRGFEYEVGREYEEQEVKVCRKGFHFCENPMDVFNYYQPIDSRYCEVEGDGEFDRDNEDSKVSCTKIRIGAEIKLPGLIQAGVKFILDRVNWKDSKESNTGYQSAATNTGDRSAASVEGNESVAMAIGCKSMVKGALGCWLVIAEWEEIEDGYHIKDVKSIRVDGNTIKVDTWYKLKNGEFVEDKQDEV